MDQWLFIFLFPLVIVVIYIILYLISQFHRDCERNKEEIGQNFDNSPQKIDPSNVSKDYRAEFEEKKHLILQKIDDLMFESALELVDIVLNHPEIGKYPGWDQMFREIRQKVIKLRHYHTEQDRILKSFEKGETIESYLAIIDLIEEFTGDTLDIKNQDPHKNRLKSQLLQDFQRIQKEFAQDKSNLSKTLAKISTLTEQQKFRQASNRLIYLQEFSQNLHFDEFLPQIQKTQAKIGINQDIWDQKEKALQNLEQGNLRQAYNQLDILDREIKFAKYEEQLVKGLRLQIEEGFKRIRSELEEIRRHLYHELHQAYNFISQNQIKRAEVILNQLQKDAEKYELFGLLRDIEDQRKQITKILNFKEEGEGTEYLEKT